MIGSILSGQHSDYVLKKLSKKSMNGEKIVSEMRLQAAVPSFFLMPAGYLIYGWSTEKSVGVYAPLIGLFICKCYTCDLLVDDFILKVSSFIRFFRSNVGFYSNFSISC
jgi:hypothetical protein